MPNFVIQSGVNLLGTAAQVRVTDTTGPTNYDITIPAGTYFFSVDTTTKNDIVQTLEALIDAAISDEGWLSVNADGRRINWAGAGIDVGYTLRLLDCDDAEPLAMLLGLYGDDYDWEYYQTHDAPATWRHSACLCWFPSGYDHPQRDAGGFPAYLSDHRVAENGAAAHLPRTVKRIVNLTLGSVPGALLRDDSLDAADLMEDGTTSPSLWRVMDPEVVTPLIHIYAADRFDGFYYLQEPLAPERIRRLIDKWSGYFVIDMTLAVADV